MESPKQEKSESHESELVSSGYIRGLNGLRAIAVLSVLLRHNFHLFRQNSENSSMLATAIYDWNTLFLNGWVGVDLFFVLSGFLISRPFFHRKKSPFRLGTYAIKRFLRIVPAYYFVLLMIVIGAFPFYQISAEEIGWRIFYHTIFMQDYFASNINVVFWSLGIEEKFYILMPLIFLLIPKIKNDYYKLALLLLPVMVSPLLRYLSFEAAGAPSDYDNFFRSTRSPFHNCLEPLFLGVCIALCEARKIKPLPAKLTFWGSAMCLCILMLFVPMLKDITYFDVTTQPLLIAILMAGLTYGVVFGIELKILQNRVTDFFARISYSLYLVHWPLFPLAFVTATLAAGDTLPLFPIFTFIFGTLSIIVAALLYTFIEKPFLTLKSRVT